MKLEGRRILVTGGATRIGAVIVETLARQGARVVAHYRSSQSEAEALADRLRANGASVWTTQADLADESACLGLIDHANALAGGLDGLVNNAAVFHKDGLAGATAQRMIAEFGVNLFAPMALMRRLAEVVERGDIVNLLDRRVVFDDPTCVPYLLSKKGLESATRAAALAYAPRLRVNAVAPGPVLPPPGKGADYLKDHAGFVPLQRTVSPEDVAVSVAFLLEQEAITGQTLFVDGGQHLRGFDATK